MLNPDQRELFFAAVRPPDGYQFDRGVGTTFSLNLMTLLITPLSLALMDVTDPEEAVGDPLALLEGLRRYAERLTVFCQAGRIAVPSQVKVNRLYQFLEKSVVEVEAPRGGVFHPKVWLLRYRADDQPPFYRFLCLSRNLTFDRSWDLMLRLEGECAQQRKYAYARNHPLGDFIQALPGLATHRVSRRVAETIACLQHEVRRVQFQAPAPFFDDELSFHPAGIPGHRGYRFSDRRWRTLVISPFLSDGLLRRITNDGEGHVLISRMDSLDQLSQRTRDRFADIYVLDESASPEAKEEEMGDTADVGGEVPGADTEPTGLHAKLFIMEAGWDATWLIGSANVTDAAFRGKNVEFVVRLQGRKSRIGIDKVLGAEDDQLSLRALLRTYTPPETPTVADTDQKRSEALAEAVRSWLIQSRLAVIVTSNDEDFFELTITRTRSDVSPPAGSYTIRCWPVTLRPDSAQAVVMLSQDNALAQFRKLSLLSLTPFTAFEVKARSGEAEHTLSFVFNLPITGIPDARQDQVFAAIISDRTAFLRYLRLLLSDEEDLLRCMPGWMAAVGADGGGRDHLEEVDVPLLEEMVRSLSRSPEKIDRIADIVERLEKTPEGCGLFPDGFEALWQAIMQVRGVQDDD